MSYFKDKVKTTRPFMYDEVSWFTLNAIRPNNVMIYTEIEVVKLV